MDNIFLLKPKRPRDIISKQSDEVASLLQVLQAADLGLTSEQKSSIQHLVEMTQAEKLIKENGAKIWLDEKVGWRGYYYNEARKKKFLKGKDENTVRKKLVGILKGQLDNPTFKEVYDDWIKRKIELECLAESTVNRYERQYNQVLNEFGEKHIRNITPDYIEDFLFKSVQEKELSSKAYSNTCTILRGVFVYARKKGLVNFSINDVLESITIPPRMFKRSKKKIEDLIFMDEEQEKLQEYFNNKKNDVVDLGIWLMFFTGLRPGELVALKWSDVENDEIDVHSTEVRYKVGSSSKDTYEVQEKAKTIAGERLVRLPTEAKWIVKEIKKLNPDGTYLFEKNGKRIKACSFDSRMRTICNKIGLKEKSMNKIRKTYATLLLDNGVSEAVVIAQMGHTNITTTKNFYYKNQKGKQQVVTMLDEAFANMPLKKISQA